MRTHFIQMKHRLLIGRFRGLHVGVCLGCGGLLGAARHLPILRVLDQLHVCSGASYVTPASAAPQKRGAVLNT